MESHKEKVEPLRTIWNRRWLILTTTMAVMSATLWWANGLPRVFESSVALAYTKEDASRVRQQEVLAYTNEQLWNKELLQPLIQSDLFKEQRAAGASPDKLLEQIRNSTSIVEEPRADGFGIRLRYRDRTPERAQLIAGNLSQIVEKLPLARGPDEAVFKLEQPVTSATIPVMPRRVILTEAAVGVGVLLGLVFAAVAEMTSRFRNGKLMHNAGH